MGWGTHPPSMNGMGPVLGMGWGRLRIARDVSRLRACTRPAPAIATRGAALILRTERMVSVGTVQIVESHSGEIVAPPALEPNILPGTGTSHNHYLALEPCAHFCVSSALLPDHVPKIVAES